MRIIRHALRITFVLSMALVPARPAQAQGAARTIVERSMTEERVGDVIASCGDFDILNDYRAVYSFTLHYDVSGAFKSWNLHWEFQADVFYNSAYPSRRLYGQADLYNDHGVVETATVRASGPQVRLTVPGSGVIYLQTGTMVVNFETGEIVLQHGPFDFYGGEVAALCAALR